MSYCLADGPRGAEHIADRHALTMVDGKSVTSPYGKAVCGARIISLDLVSLQPKALDLLYKATCKRCQQVVWSKQGDEEWQTGARA